MSDTIPEKCTLCGGTFKGKDGKKRIYPYPHKQYLCHNCLVKSLDAGLGRLNKVLRGEELTVEDWSQR